MAKLSAHGDEFGRVEHRSVLYRVMADGVILRQFRAGGRLDRPTLFSRRFQGNPPEALAALRKRFEVER
jgi:hypothetical protein